MEADSLATLVVPATTAETDMTDPNPSPTTRIETPGSDPPATDGDATGPPETPPSEDPPLDTPSPEAAPTAPPPATWEPPKRQDHGRTASIVFGLIVLAVGSWFFADQTLGLVLPSLRLSQLWPLILIVIGGWILLGAMRRRSG
jgi:hypothetical protein